MVKYVLQTLLIHFHFCVMDIDPSVCVDIVRLGAENKIVL